MNTFIPKHVFPESEYDSESECEVGSVVTMDDISTQFDPASNTTRATVYQPNDGSKDQWPGSINDAESLRVVLKGLHAPPHLGPSVVETHRMQLQVAGGAVQVSQQ